MAGVTSVVIDGVTYPVDDVNAVDFSVAQGLTDGQQEQARENIGAGSAAYALLLCEEIPNTVQTITFDEETGNVASISHMNGQTEVRSDVFTFAIGSITEVRTLDSGESLTITTNTTTLETTVTYSAT